MPTALDRIVTGLLSARFFEDAAKSVLGAILELADEGLAKTEFGPRARVVRGMVHLRPSDGYRQLVVVERSSPAAAPSGAPPSSPSGGRTMEPHMPSATAWRAVLERRCAVSVNTVLGTLEAHTEGASTPLEEAGSAEFSTGDSRERLLSRAATHVLVVPLRVAGGGIDGVVCVEVDCRGAIAQDLCWNAFGPAVQQVADVAAPHLSRLRLAPAPAPPPDPLLPVVGAHMARLVDLLRVFARQNETILLTGPTGAGKSRLARWCHATSPRKSGPFETVDLLSVPDELQMSTLFGWRRGAFTGATRDGAGAVSRAHGGTLFLDEVDKLSARAQAGLLRLLEERRYRPIGEESRDVEADVRFVVGTNARLEDEVAAGRFREDLYFRVNVLALRVPGLSERADEVGPWARYMVERRHREANGEGAASLSPKAEASLAAGRWPGNLRQLDNVVRRSYAIALLDEVPERDLVVDVQHVELALRSEAGSPAARTGSAVESLREAAARLVDEAQRRGPDDPLDLDLAEGLRGLVLEEAVARCGNRDDAFRLLGKAALLANRNHHKVLRRDLDRAKELLRALGVVGAGGDEP